MNKFFKLLIAGILVISMCLPTAVFAAELNACGTYASIMEGGSVLAYPDGSFQGEDSNFVTNKVSSGFEYLRVGSSTYNDNVTTSNSLTYHKGIGGKASDDRSAKLSAYGYDAVLGIAELSDTTETNNYFYHLNGEDKDFFADDVFVFEADFLFDGMSERQFYNKFGNSSTYTSTITFGEDGSVKVTYYNGSNTSTNKQVVELGTYAENKWYHIKTVYNRADGNEYIFIDGVQKAHYTDRRRTNNTSGLTSVRFVQKGGSATTPANMYVDDIEIYVSTNLDSALDTTNAVVSDLTSKSTNCTVDNTNSAITYTTGNPSPLVTDLKAAVQGNISGVLRDGTLITDGSIQNGDAVVVLSTDGRTFRYYTLTLNVVIVNLLADAEIIENSWVWEDYELDPADMFDDDADTYYSPKFAGSDDGELVLDLKEIKTFNQLSILNNTSSRGRYIRFSVSVSNDNVTYTDVVKDAVIQDEAGHNQIINFKETSARYVKLNLNIHVGTETTKMYISEIKLFNNTKPENICENVAINAASTHSNNTSNSAGYYAWIDGDADTMYMSGSLTSGTYILDLGQRKNFNKLYLKMGGNTYYLGSCNLKVSVSNDNSTYSTVKEYTEIAATAEKNEELSATMSGRYIKLEFTNIAHDARSARLNIKEFGLYYDGNEADPLDTGYTCLITKNTEGTKLNAAVDASAAIGEGFGGVIIGAVYDKDWKLLKATILDEEFAVAANSEFSHTYELDYVSGTKYAKVFFWNSLTELVPMYGHNEYRE